jgi:hypothetical protein
MELSHPLRLVAPTLDADLLEVLAAADRGFTGRELARAVGSSQEGARGALARLVAQGIVRRQRVGSALLYALNREHLGAPLIVALADLRAELLRRIGASLSSWPLPAVYAALFGSAARGQERPDSDLDLFVLRPSGVPVDDSRWAAQVQDLSARVATWTGNDARVLDIGMSDLQEVYEPGGVVDDVLRDGIPLAGSEADLRRALRTIRSRSWPPRALPNPASPRVDEQRPSSSWPLLKKSWTLPTTPPDIGDAYVTLCVHAGIAAADSICAHRLKQHHIGDNHHEAVAMLRQVQPDGHAFANDLDQLLKLKTKAGYTHRPVTADERKLAGRRARTLVDAARALRL